MEVDITTLLPVLVPLAFAGLVHGTLGLGFPLTATPLIALFMDVQSAILLTLFPTITVNIISILHGGHWRESIGRFWPLAAFAVAGSVLGSVVLVYSDPSPFRLLLAVVILLYLNVERISHIETPWIKRYQTRSMLGFGFLAGFLAGTVNVMVPVLVIFFLELGLKTTAMVQVFNLCFMSGKIAQVGVFSAAGLLDLSLILVSVPAMVVSAGALMIGIKIRNRISPEGYRLILRRLLLVTAAILVVQYFFY